jgi:hypothetical protein
MLLRAIRTFFAGFDNFENVGHIEIGPAERFQRARCRSRTAHDIAVLVAATRFWAGSPFAERQCAKQS